MIAGFGMTFESHARKNVNNAGSRSSKRSEHVDRGGRGRAGGGYHRGGHHEDGYNRSGYRHGYGYGHSRWGVWPWLATASVLAAGAYWYDYPSYGRVQCWSENVDGISAQRCFIPDQGYIIYDDARSLYWNEPSGTWSSSVYYYPQP